MDDPAGPVPRQRLRRMLRHAYAHPWPGNVPLTCSEHFLDTTARTEPGRPTRLLLSLDVGYHASGWWANSDYAQCLHISISHPRHDAPLEIRRAPANVGGGQLAGVRLEAPSEAEVRAWGRLIFAVHAPKSWYEPPVGPLDPYRTAGVAHLRLFLDQELRPIIPRGEPYNLRPFPDGSSPPKITEGRAGADVR